MFIIHGIFNCEPTQRLVSNLTQFSVNFKSSFIHSKFFEGEIFDFSLTFSDFEKNVLLLNSFVKKASIVPPSFKIAEFYAHFSDFIIVRFPYKIPLKPACRLPDFEKTLKEFLPLKHKTIIELSGESADFNMYTASFNILSYNQAILKCAVKGAKTFFDENSFCSYYTYLDTEGHPHLVYMEDTKSISQKHNMVKDYGFYGICWKDVAQMADGNWESLKGAFEKAQKKAQS